MPDDLENDVSVLWRDSLRRQLEQGGFVLSEGWIDQTPNALGLSADNWRTIVSLTFWRAELTGLSDLELPFNNLAFTDLLLDTPFANLIAFLVRYSEGAAHAQEVARAALERLRADARAAQRRQEQSQQEQGGDYGRGQRQQEQQDQQQQQSQQDDGHFGGGQQQAQPQQQQSQQGNYNGPPVSDVDLQQRVKAFERDLVRETVEAAGTEIFGAQFVAANPYEPDLLPLQPPQQEDYEIAGWALPERGPQRPAASVRIEPPIAEAPAPAPPAAAIPPPGQSTYRVWYATNRAPADTNGPTGSLPGFMGRRDPKNVTRYGACDVFVPRSHKFGSIGSGLITRLFTQADDRLKIVGVADRPEEDYWRGIREQLASSSSANKQAVVFLHGYNVSFDDAALRAAQIGYDLGVEAMAFFSWPSQGKLTLTGYTSDGNSIEASEASIADFLVKFAERVEANSIHVIAHSMGNRGLMRAVARISAEAERRSDRQFDNFVLAAADVDADTFRTFAGEYAKLARRTTLYVSRKDKALMFAKFLSDYDRIGYWPPVAIFPQMDTISVSEVDLSVIGHGFVAELAPVLGDLHQLFTSNLPPAERIRLEEVVTDAGKYWKIRA